MALTAVQRSEVVSRLELGDKMYKCWSCQCGNEDIDGRLLRAGGAIRNFGPLSLAAASAPKHYQPSTASQVLKLPAPSPLSHK